MKNRIWVGMNDVGSSYQSDKELIVAENGNIREKVSKDDCRASDSYKYDIYNLNLKPLEIVEVIIDTETQKYEVKRERKKGWYLTVWLTDDKRAIARYWNGDAFHSNRNCGKCIPIPESEITVIYELPECDYLRSLE
jgi:hypothetical protein